VHCKLNPRDSVMTNAGKLAKLPSGGTNCSAPLRWLNDTGAVGDLVIFVSDNESWIDTKRPNWLSAGQRSGPTETMRQWSEFKRRNPRAKLVCIDIQPNPTAQAPDRGDILNVGGFSDAVFDLVHEFASGNMEGGHWVGVIENVRL
jgi:60 kDa SS-A/Ro ribonucleoprotein